MVKRKAVSLLGIFALMGVLSGCTMTVMAAGQIMYDDIQRDKWRELAEMGNREAQYYLGKAYCCGEGVGYNNVEATKWLCRSAKNGYIPAQIEIGRVFRSYEYILNPLEFAKRTSFPLNNVIALSWFSIAAYGGSEEANAELNEIAKNLTQEEIERAIVLAKNYPNIHCEIGEKIELARSL